MNLRMREGWKDLMKEFAGSRRLLISLASRVDFSSSSTQYLAGSDKLFMF